MKIIYRKGFFYNTETKYASKITNTLGYLNTVRINDHFKFFYGSTRNGL